ncbi:MAG: hypothetical protein SWY16_12740 [Cyanobacteriota bacterium]|nr:hypothetical protein [Cyanobacteriota bacterium]
MNQRDGRGRSNIIGQTLSSVWFLPLALVGIKLWLTRDFPLLTYFGSHDDLRYIVMADTFTHFELPPYDRFTLMRQPGYPAYIALSYSLGLSLRFSQELLYLGSGLFLGRSLYKYYPNRWVIHLFSALYILNPGSFQWNRLIMPEVLYVPLTVFIVGCLLRLIHSSERGQLWSAILGLALAWFWNTRPEGVWIIPTIAFSYGIFIWKKMGQKDGDSQLDRPFFKTLLTSITLVVTPALILTAAISLFNYVNYGLYLTNDLTAPGFKAAYSQMIRVNPDRWRRWVPVPEETRQQIYRVSPSFAQLSKFLETDKGQAWFALTCNERVNICDDYIGGVFLWALRDAVADIGYYRSAVETEKFYRKIAEEIKIACQENRLNCHRSNFSSFSPKFHPEYIGYFGESLVMLAQNSIGSALDLNLSPGYENDELYQTHYQEIARESLEFRKQYSEHSIEVSAIEVWTKLYEFLLPILFGLSILGVLAKIWPTSSFLSRASIPISVFGVFISCTLTRLLLISYIRTVSMPVKGFRYLWPGVPFLLLAIAIGFSYLIPIIFKINKFRL